MFAVVWISAAGCKSWPANPWESAPPVAETAEAQQQQQQSGVEQASYQATTTPGVSLPPPGASLTGVAGEDEEFEKTGFEQLSSALSPSQNYKRAKILFGLGPDEKLAREYYEKGDALFREKKYDEAADWFESAAGRWPDSALEEDALFMLGESYFFADRYATASDVFVNLLKKYENSRHLDRVVARQFAIGRYWDEIGRDSSWYAVNFTDKKRPFFDTGGNAVANFIAVRTNDPTGPLADDATMATANANFLDEKYEDAAYYYGLARKEFPQSEHQLQAHLLGLQSNLRAYKGPQYDARPLKNAGELAPQTKSQFGAQLTPDQMSRLERDQLAIRNQLAEREWAAGEFELKKGQNLAAAIYYNEILKKYSDTRFAPMARERLASLRGKPPYPPDRFGWVKKIIPESDKLKRR